MAGNAYLDIGDEEPDEFFSAVNPVVVRQLWHGFVLGLLSDGLVEVDGGSESHPAPDPTGHPEPDAHPG